LVWDYFYSIHLQLRSPLFGSLLLHNWFLLREMVVLATRRKDRAEHEGGAGRQGRFKVEEGSLRYSSWGWCWLAVEIILNLAIEIQLVFSKWFIGDRF
jgi:hypothetical protein